MHRELHAPNLFRCKVARRRRPLRPRDRGPCQVDNMLRCDKKQKIVTGMHWTGLPDQKTDHIDKTCPANVKNLYSQTIFGQFVDICRHFSVFLVCPMICPLYQKTLRHLCPILAPTLEAVLRPQIIADAASVEGSAEEQSVSIARPFPFWAPCETQCKTSKPHLKSLKGCEALPQQIHEQLR